jgi:4-diphosphocytidyl-2-C-methyl-D-erythritol kinase
MKLLSPAKINLFLQITGKRPDGYHELFTLMCCVDLCDTISFGFGSEKITVSCPAPNIPEDETNLAHKAASLFFNNAGIREGVEIFIDKKIPAGAGLGGGSSNAATVLRGLNQYYRNPFSADKLMQMGLLIGADVPFFIFQKPALATGIGEKLTPYNNLIPYKIVIIYPGVSVSTAEVYKNFNLGLTNCKKRFKSYPFKDYGFNAEYHLCNDLETVSESKYPDIMAAKRVLLEHGAKGALMSGSGSAVFGLFYGAKEAGNAGRKISDCHGNWNIYTANILL